MKNTETAFDEALGLLRRLIATPRTSRNEKAAADLVEQDLREHGFSPERTGNNVLCKKRGFDPSRPAVLLNSHIDTVKPVSSWTLDPYTPVERDGRLYGIGSNDAGASLVSLLQVFYLTDDANTVFLATCEEEVSGEGGMKRMAPLLPTVSTAIVGEPTGMQPAVAEKGLMVLDLAVHGKSGHAARDEGVNAIYRAIEVMEIIRDYRFEKVSPLLGPVKMSVTVINAGTQHNVVPDLCTMTVDVRSNEFYRNEEVLAVLRRILPEWCDMKARSLTLNSSGISLEHPLIRRAVELGLKPFGSPTLSDQSVLGCTSFKMGPGQSSRSHSADEYVCLDELRQAIPTYLAVLG